MGLVKKMRKQRARYWKRAGTDHYGDPAFDWPVDVDCRWEDRTGEYRNVRGETNVSTATVYVDRKMYRGDRLKKLEPDEVGVKSKDAIIGHGTPEGVITAGKGKYYWDLDSKTQWIKETATGNTGWYEQFGGGSATEVVVPEPADPLAPEDPLQIPGALEIQAFDMIPDLKNREKNTLMIAHL
jgi:hypothetical protein